MRRLLIAAVMTLSACGGSASTSPTTPTTPTNRVPVITVASITPNFGIDSLTLFSFQGVAADPDGDALTYSWLLANGETFTGPTYSAAMSAAASFVAR